MVATPVRSRTAAEQLEDRLQRARSAQLRRYLTGGCALSVAAALWLGNPDLAIAADADLVRLLRGMALIKAVIVLGALALLSWRFGLRLSARLAGLYLVGAWLIAGASTMIWQLAQIPTAAFSFHLGAFLLLAAAWRDRSN